MHFSKEHTEIAVCLNQSKCFFKLIPLGGNLRGKVHPFFYIKINYKSYIYKNCCQTKKIFPADEVCKTFTANN